MAEEFNKKTVKKFGERGESTYHIEQQTTDLDTLSENVEEVAIPFCECGSALTGEVYRCCNCDIISCYKCKVELSRYNYCPTCALQNYGLDKAVYLTLLFVQHDLLALDDLIEITTHDGEVTTLVIDAAADALVEHDYLTSEETLSATGREALHIGHQLYGDDGDVRAVRERLRLQEVVDG